VLLSLCETCKYKNVDFLAFLRSGSIDIDEFALSHAKQPVRRAGKSPFELRENGMSREEL